MVRRGCRVILRRLSTSGRDYTYNIRYFRALHDLEPPMKNALSFGDRIELTGTFHINQWKHPEMGWLDFYVLDLEKRINITGNEENYLNVSELQLIVNDFDPKEYDGLRVRIKGLLDAAEENSQYRRPMCIYNPEIETLD